MSAWLSLTKKELRLGMPVFLMPIIVFIVSVSIAFYIGNRNGFAWEAVVGVAAAATGVQIFYLAYYLFYSLQSEKKKLHLWLHNPMPGYSLLLAKVAAGFVSMLITLLLTGTTVLVTVNLSSMINEQIQVANITELVFFAGIHLVLLALSFAAFFLFYWMIFLVFTRRLGTVVSFLSTFVIFVALTSFYNWFTQSLVYQKLTMWGGFQLEMLEGISFNVDNSGAEVMSETANLSLFAGSYLFETILALLLFFAASWMLDKKVEV
ncbi:hypothetical protein [Halalkalibacter lacteus]|uniref:hypothetical protein n=1 Tax=Halalkalibacter lacteus TaxID=3090663 RepID=UPI002FCB7883